MKLYGRNRNKKVDANTTVLTLSVLHLSVFQNNPNRGHKICSKKGRKSFLYFWKIIGPLLVEHSMLSTCKYGSLEDHRAYKPYSLVGPPALPLVLDPLAVIFLNNHL